MDNQQPQMPGNNQGPPPHLNNPNNQGGGPPRFPPDQYRTGSKGGHSSGHSGGRSGGGHSGGHSGGGRRPHQQQHRNKYQRRNQGRPGPQYPQQRRQDQQQYPDNRAGGSYHSDDYQDRDQRYPPRDRQEYTGSRRGAPNRRGNSYKNPRNPEYTKRYEGGSYNSQHNEDFDDMELDEFGRGQRIMERSAFASRGHSGGPPNRGQRYGDYEQQRFERANRRRRYPSSRGSRTNRGGQRGYRGKYRRGGNFRDRGGYGGQGYRDFDQQDRDARDRRGKDNYEDYEEYGQQTQYRRHQGLGRRSGYYRRGGGRGSHHGRGGAKRGARRGYTGPKRGKSNRGKSRGSNSGGRPVPPRNLSQELEKQQGRQQQQAPPPAAPERGQRPRPEPVEEPEAQSSHSSDFQDVQLTPAQEKLLKKYNTLDRGTYYIDQNDKSIHFLIQGRNDLVGWHDDYVINGYLLPGLIIKIKTLSSKVFMFMETDHEIYKTFLKYENGKLSWSDKVEEEPQILTLRKTEKVEVYDNYEEGFEGFICYIATEETKLETNPRSVNIQNWVDLQRELVLYEPTSIRRIYLDTLYNRLDKPESSEFNGKRIAAIINPDVPGETVRYSKRLTYALEKKCVVGSISTQLGIYTLMAEQIQEMRRFADMVEKILDIAEELAGYVMITNLRRTFDYDGQTVLYLPKEPTLKILTFEGTINFSNKSKKSLALN